MALIQCPECGKEVSDRTEKCIYCGIPLNQTQEKLSKENTNIVYCYNKGIQNLYLRCSCGQEFKYINTMYKRNILDNGDYKFEAGGLPIMCPRCHSIYDTISFRPETDPYFEFKNSDKINDTTVKCPKCGSTQIQMVPRKWSLATGFLTNKVDRVCMNCKCKF